MSPLRSPRAFVVALVLGATTGLVLGQGASALAPVGSAFVLALQAAAPVIVFLSVTGTWQEMRRQSLGRFGGLVMALSLLGTALACLVAATIGAGLNVSALSLTGLTASPASALPPRASIEWRELLAIPGLGLAAVSGEALAALARRGEIGAARAQQAMAFAHAARDRLITVLMTVAPLGAFALVAVAVGRASRGVMATAAGAYIAVALGQAAVALALWATLRLARDGAPLPPLRDMFIGALATGSSAASLPLETRTAQALGLPAGPSSLSLSLGIAVSKIGTASFLAALASFSGGSLIRVIPAAALAGMATPPVSGAGLLMLTWVFQQTGLDPTAAAILAGLPLIGKLNTPINALGRIAVTAWAVRHLPAPLVPARD